MTTSIPDTIVMKVHTSGLYRNDLSLDDAGQPWVMSMAALLCNAEGAVTNAFYHIARAEGRTTKEKAAAVHGLDPRIADQVGIPEQTLLAVLAKMLRTVPPSVPRVVTFGELDVRVIASAMARHALASGKPSNAYDHLWLNRTPFTVIDLQKPYCQLVCRLPSDLDGGDFRWPSLPEAAATILGRTTDAGPRNALDDMVAIKDLYFELVRRGHLARHGGKQNE